MIKNVLDRLDGIENSKLIKELTNLLDNAEELGLSCKEYLYGEGTRDKLLKNYDSWQEQIDAFYERYIK